MTTNDTRADAFADCAFLALFLAMLAVGALVTLAVYQTDTEANARYAYSVQLNALRANVAYDREHASR